MFKVKVLVELDIDDDEYFEDCSDTSEKSNLHPARLVRAGYNKVVR